MESANNQSVIVNSTRESNKITTINVPHTHSYVAMATAVGLTSTLLVAYNVFTVSIMIASRSLRKSSNIPIMSFLLAATFQCSLALPVYMYKTMEHIPEHRPKWICDVFNFPYFFCGHVMKVSLVVVSFERLIAIRWPYRYKDLCPKWSMSLIIIGAWVFVGIVDIIPFIPFNKERETGQDGSTDSSKSEFLTTLLETDNRTDDVNWQ